MFWLRLNELISLAIAESKQTHFNFETEFLLMDTPEFFHSSDLFNRYWR